MEEEVYRAIGVKLRNQILDRYGTTKDEELAEDLGLPVDWVRQFAEERGLKKSKVWIKEQGGGTRMPRWTADEIELLTEFYPHLPAYEIAQRLGRSTKAVISKAHKLRLQKSFERLVEMGRENVSLRYEEEEKGLSAP